MDRHYYSRRTGKGHAVASLDLNDVKRIFSSQFKQWETEGYFQEDLGYQCVDEGFVPGLIGTDLQAEIQLVLGKTDLWPIEETLGNWSEDDLFDMVEFLFDHVSKPTTRRYHDYHQCGWHCTAFDREAGKIEYSAKVNRILRAYDFGFELTTNGEVIAIPPTGFDNLTKASLPSGDKDNVENKVAEAISKFQRHRSSIEDRKMAVRELVDVLEFLRPQLKDVLDSRDESDLFNIANNFAIRHHRSDQKFNYDKSIWLSWMFYFYLATVHAAIRLIDKKTKQA